MAQAIEVVRPRIIEGPKANSHNTPTDQFARWIYETSKNGTVISKQRIAREMHTIKDGAKINEAMVTSWIAKARLYCETQLNCTLWNIPGEGWRVASQRETAIYYCKCVKKTIAWADRTLNLQAISDRREIPGAIKEVFYKAEKGIESLSGQKKRYFEIWMGILKKQAEEQKLISDK